MANLLNLRKFIPITSQQNSFLKLQTALDKMLEEFYSGVELPTFLEKDFENLTISPAIDIVDDENHFKVEFEMPGVGEEDIQINISEGILSIKGQKETSRQDKNKNYFMREISYGAYERSIRLPASVDIEKAKATFKKGMLWVDIPKKMEDLKQRRKLKVEKV